MIETVFSDLHEAASTPRSWKLFPPFYKEQLQLADGDANRITRTVSDYISSMTEKEVTRNFQLLTGRQ